MCHTKGAWLGRNPRGPLTAPGHATRRPGAAVAILTAPAVPARPVPSLRAHRAQGYDADAPAAFAASRTAPATAPATLSLKTLGMM